MRVDTRARWGESPFREIVDNDPRLSAMAEEIARLEAELLTKRREFRMEMFRFVETLACLGLMAWSAFAGRPVLFVASILLFGVTEIRLRLYHGRGRR